MQTHFHLTGQALKNYMDGNFWDAWRFMDSAEDGKVEAERIPTLLRMVAHDNRL